MNSTSFENLHRILIQHSVTFQVIRHAYLFTMNDVVRELKIPEQSAAKTLLISVTNKGLIRIVLQGSDRLDFSKLTSLLQVSRKDVYFAEKDVLEQAGFTVGAIPPFGGELPTYIDQSLLGPEMVYCGTGDNDKTFFLRPQDIVLLSSALIVDIIKQKTVKPKDTL